MGFNTVKASMRDFFSCSFSFFDPTREMIVGPKAKAQKSLNGRFLNTD